MVKRGKLDLARKHLQLVVKLDPLWIEFDCPLEDQHLFAVGAQAHVRRASATRERRAARIVHTSMRADPSSGTFRVRLELANAERAWKAGLKVWIEPRATAVAPAPK